MCAVREAAKDKMKILLDWKPEENIITKLRDNREVMNTGKNVKYVVESTFVAQRAQMKKMRLRRLTSLKK